VTGLELSKMHFSSMRCTRAHWDIFELNGMNVSSVRCEFYVINWELDVTC